MYLKKKNNLEGWRRCKLSGVCISLCILLVELSFVHILSRDKLVESNLKRCPWFSLAGLCIVLSCISVLNLGIDKN